MYYLNVFFLYSILGYLMEIGVCFICKNTPESGYLYGPWTPVYGIGVLILIALSHFIFQVDNKWLQVILLFFSSMILLSFIEWLGGMLLEHLFSISLWDYSDHKFALGKYISLEMAIIWGILSVLVIYIIKPVLDSILYKIPPFITIIAIILFIIDNGITIFHYLTKK